MSATARLRVGVVGSGFGANVHVPAYQAHPRFEVVALASPGRASSVAAERGIPHAFPSCSTMLEEIELDVVSVASPPVHHHRDVLAALARNKHVLCEKPFAVNLAQAQEMEAQGRRAGTACALAFEFRYVPARIATYELVRNGHLGPLRQIEMAYFASGLRASVEGPNSWWFDRTQGGGIANAIVPHLFDQALWLAGREPLTTLGFLRTANPERRSGGEVFRSTVADGAFSVLDFGEGLAATVSADGTHVKNSTLIAVHGEARTTVFSGSSMTDGTTFLVDEDETAELGLRANPYEKPGLQTNVALFLSLLDDFVRAIDGVASTVPTFGDGLAVQRCLEAIGYRA
ncbi:MAG TPA: Gfo/Idh/MocA family oxidoreductase [Candidatus Acidoferrales bacterium]|nr:Gfo/Idh/MocA family oxidoreductase [Candidatus Acidoferrales bacterium]